MPNPHHASNPAGVTNKTQGLLRFRTRFHDRPDTSKNRTPGERLDLENAGIPVGTVPVDGGGNTDLSLANTDSRTASVTVGTTLTLRSALTGGSAATTVVFDPKVFAWVSTPGSNVGPLVSMITNTELAAAGFVPTLLALTETSSNASIVSQLSAFDSTTDTITTAGFYNLLSAGPVFGTYRIDGTSPTCLIWIRAAFYRSLPVRFSSPRKSGQLSQSPPAFSSSAPASPGWRIQRGDGRAATSLDSD